MTLFNRGRSDLLVAADCLLAFSRGEEEDHKALAGALLLADGLACLRAMVTNGDG